MRQYVLNRISKYIPLNSQNDKIRDFINVCSLVNKVNKLRMALHLKETFDFRNMSEKISSLYVVF